jgi:hypothetical protein
LTDTSAIPFHPDAACIDENVLAAVAREIEKDI